MKVTEFWLSAYRIAELDCFRLTGAMSNISVPSSGMEMIQEKAEEQLKSKVETNIEEKVRTSFETLIIF